MRRALRLFGLSLLTFGMSGLLLAAPPGPGGGFGGGPGPGPHGPGLPSFAHELWIGSALYFVAAGTYYLWNAGSQRYEEVSPPPAVPSDSGVASYEVIAYPARGQGTEQQARDRYECHGWAVGQSGFDPASATQAVGVETSERYRRALGACLSGRGYSVN